jgi:TonB family protein
MKFPLFSILVTTFLLSSCGTSKSSKVQVSTSDDIIEYPDVEGQYPGGIKAMKKHLTKNIDYPEQAEIYGDQGKVFIQFVIEKDGSLSNIEVLKGVTKEIDAEAIRVISKMPKWTPAIYEDKYVRARARLPINFILM